jgi:hypothetical protein
MTFAAKPLTKIQDQALLLEADSIRIHKIGDEVFEISVDGQRVLLSIDISIDPSFRLVEFLSSLGPREC